MVILIHSDLSISMTMMKVKLKALAISNNLFQVFGTQVKQGI